MVNSSVLRPAGNGRVPDPATHGAASLLATPPKIRTEFLQDKFRDCRGAPPAPPGGRGHSSVGRASALQAECRRFESDCLHQTHGRVAQLVRASH